MVPNPDKIDWTKVKMKGLDIIKKELALEFDIRLDRRGRILKNVERYTPTFTDHFPYFDIKAHKIYKDNMRLTSKEIDNKVFKKNFKLPFKRKLSDNFLSKILFRTHGECRFMGTWKLGVYKSKQSIGAPPIGSLMFLRKLPDYLDDVDAKLVDDLPLRYAIKGSWPTQQAEFEAYCNQSVTDKGVDFYFECIKDSLHKIILPKMPDLPIDHIFYTGTNPDSSAGLLTGLLFPGKNIHKYQDRYIKEAAYELVNQKISKELTGDRTLWTVGGRTRYQKFVPGDILRSRLLIMPEGVPKIIKSWVVDPFYDESIQINKFRIENEIQIGLNLRQGRFKHFFDQYTYCPMVIEGDMKRFDQNANSSIITLAFSIIRSCYPQGKKWDLIFAYIMSGDLHKNICTPDGEVYKISKGIPTGSPFTTVLGCVVNWIAWTTTFSKLGFSPEDYRLVCYGDDMLCGLLKYNYEITPEIICKTMLDCCGFTVSPCKVFDMFGLDGLDEQPSLLKTYSLFGLPARKFEDIMERALFSDIRGINRFDHAMRITGSFYNAPFNFEAMRVLSIFRVFLYKSARNSFPLNSKYYDNRFLSINAFYTSLKAGVASFYDISKNASKSSGLPWLNKSKFVSSVIKRRTHDPGVQLIRDLFGVLNKKKSDRLVDYQCGILDSFRGNCYYRLE